MTGALPRQFYERPTLIVAQDLLGKILVRRIAHDTVLKARLVEVEAYAGETDPGSHAYRGPTSRTQVMFGEAGHLYVYFTYGMHHCMNVVTEAVGVAGAVLLRAAEPLTGIELMESARARRPLVELCNGPAKLCQAFGVSREQNGEDLTRSELWLEDDGSVVPEVTSTTRVGLRRGAELPYRFYLKSNLFVSRGRPSA